MGYELDIITATKNNLFLFKKSAKLTVVIYDENKKKIAMYDELGWLMY